MKTNLRSLFGYVTIACILLAIFRRLILLALDECSVDWWHCVCGPWYADLYLLGLDGFWTFSGSVDELARYDNAYHELHMVTVVVSTVFWFIVHIAATLFVGFGIYDLFFKSAGTAKSEAGENPEQG